MRGGGNPNARRYLPASVAIWETQMFWIQKTSSVCALLTAFLLLPATLSADGLSAVISCETDGSPPEEIARLAILPNGESRGSDTAATLIKMAKQKAKEGKDTEALQWAMLCQFDTKEQEAIKRDNAAVLEYLKR
jgi:hypothetical protein